MSKLQNKTYIAKTFYGLEGVLAKELTDLGATNVEEINRAVSFEGDRALMYKANLKLYTALRILEPFHEFEANDEDELYAGIQTLNWGEYFSIVDTFKIDPVVVSSLFTHSQYVAYKVKDAISDQFREKNGRRPNVDLEEPDFTINVLISENIVRLSWDCSGDSLHKRGYRLETGPAPINEVLAAGLVKLSGWDEKSPLIDPMCGSGTILIEAALIATNTAPGLFRKKFAFMGFEDFDRRLWLKIKNECKRETKEMEGFISGYDKSWRLLEVAEKNVVEAKMDDHIKLSKQNFFDANPKFENGTLIFNPPYGERLDKGEMSIEDLYENIGDKLKQDYTGFEAWLITSNMDALKEVGLKTSARIKVFNGGQEGRFVHYNLYEGSKKGEYIAGEGETLDDELMVETLIEEMNEDLSNKEDHSDKDISDNDHSDEDLTNEAHSGKDISNKDLTDEDHSDEDHSDEDHSDEEHSDEDFADEALSISDLSDEDFTDEGLSIDELSMDELSMDDFSIDDEMNEDEPI